MAIRFDASADGLSRANPNTIGPTDLYTVAFWIYLATDSNFYNALWTVNTNDSANNFNLDVILLLDDGVSLASYVGNHLDSGFSTPGTALSLNTWYYIAGVRDAIGANGFKVYLNGVLDTQNAYDCTGRTASFTREEIANLYTGNSFGFNGRMYNFMRWSRVLTVDEIKYQMTRFEPIHRGSLRLWTPMRDRGPTARKWDRIRGNYWTTDGTLTDESNPPMTKVGGQFKKYFFMPLAVAGQQIVTLGLLTETNTIQPDLRLKTKAIGLLDTTETIQPIGRQKTVAMGQLSETSTVQQSERNKTRDVAQLTATEQLLTIIANRIIELGFLEEGETLQSISRQKNISLSQLDEVNSILAVVANKTKELGELSELNTLLAIAGAKIREISLLIETETIQPITTNKIKDIGLLEEISSLFPITQSGQIIYTLGQLAENNFLFGIERVKNKSLAQLLETSTILEITRNKAKTLSQLSEINSLFDSSRSKTQGVNILVETGTLFPITQPGEIVYTLGLLEETNTLLSIARVKYFAIGSLVENNSLFTVSRQKNVALGLLAESSLLFVITGGEPSIAHYIYVVPAENRVYVIPSEIIETLADRTYKVPHD